MNVTSLNFNEQAANSLQNSISVNAPKLVKKTGDFVKKFDKINKTAADTFSATVTADANKGFLGTVKQKFVDVAKFVGDKATTAGKYVKDKAKSFAKYVADKTAPATEFVSKKTQPVTDFVTKNFRKIADKTPESVKSFLTKTAKFLKNPVVLGVITTALAFLAINKLSKARD